MAASLFVVGKPMNKMMYTWNHIFNLNYRAVHKLWTASTRLSLTLVYTQANTLADDWWAHLIKMALTNIIQSEPNIATKHNTLLWFPPFSGILQTGKCEVWCEHSTKRIWRQMESRKPARWNHSTQRNVYCVPANKIARRVLKNIAFMYHNRRPSRSPHSV